MHMQGEHFGGHFEATMAATYHLCERRRRRLQACFTCDRSSERRFPARENKRWEEEENSEDTRPTTEGTEDGRWRRNRNSQISTSSFRPPAHLKTERNTT